MLQKQSDFISICWSGTKQRWCWPPMPSCVKRIADGGIRCIITLIKVKAVTVNWGAADKQIMYNINISEHLLFKFNRMWCVSVSSFPVPFHFTAFRINFDEFSISQVWLDAGSNNGGCFTSPGSRWMTITSSLPRNQEQQFEWFSFNKCWILVLDFRRKALFESSLIGWFFYLK